MSVKPDQVQLPASVQFPYVEGASWKLPLQAIEQLRAPSDAKPPPTWDAFLSLKRQIQNPPSTRIASTRSRRLSDEEPELGRGVGKRKPAAVRFC